MRALLLFLLASSSPALASGAAVEKTPRNVLFLLADDFAVEAVGALGNPEVKTPNLDRLVARGTTFTHAYCMGSWSPAVCLPSRSMLLSGRSLWRVDGSLEGVRTWPEVMRDAGFTTFGVGKWHNAPEAFARGFTDGGNIFFGAMSSHRAVPVTRFRKDGRYRQRPTMASKFSTVLFTDDVVDFLGRHDGARPFFAYVAFTAPHDPFQAPAEFKELYEPDELALPAAYRQVHPFDNGDLLVRDEQLAPFPRTPDIVRRHRAGYYAMVSHLDAQLGRILAALAASPAADDTLILFAGDHGLSLGRHGLLGKQNLYEASLRTPAIFVGEGIPADRRVATPHYLYDLFPTVLELLGLPAVEDIDGRSFADEVRGTAPDDASRRTTIYAAYQDVQRAVRDERYKLIRYKVAGKERDQLFDLVEDPDEEHDLARDPKYRETIERLDRELARWQAETEDPHAF